MQKEYLIFFNKPDSGDDFTFENYDVVARVRVPDIRYVYYCCQNTTMMWTENITTILSAQEKHRNMQIGDAFTSIDTLESWKITTNNLPEPIEDAV